MSDDFNFEPVKGLPEVLPAGEQMLWQGSPRWQDLAVHALHARKALWYFLGLAVLQAAVRLGSGSSLAEAARPFLWLIPLGLVAAGLLAGIAYASARTTVYTITSKRLALRIGIALPITINLPFKVIDGASVRVYGDGAGDIPLKLNGGERVPYMILWPHARPFHFRHPQPCLRAIPNADKVASILAAALASNPPAGQTAHRNEPGLAPGAVTA